MAAIFRINQGGVLGAWDVSRRDITVFGTGGTVTFEARDPATSYLFELISEPPGSLVVPVNPATALCSMDFLVTGGYLVRLTVDSGTATEDITVRYVGIALGTSGLCIPAFNELDFDNSIDPLAAKGYEEKITTFFKWIDSHGVSNSQVKVRIADPTADFLQDKIIAGDHISLTLGAPGPHGEFLTVAADSDGATLTGHGNPNGVVLSSLGAEYYDLDTGVFYKNADGGGIWFVL